MNKVFSYSNLLYNLKIYGIWNRNYCVGRCELRKNRTISKFVFPKNLKKLRMITPLLLCCLLILSLAQNQKLKPLARIPLPLGSVKV